MQVIGDYQPSWLIPKNCHNCQDQHPKNFSMLLHVDPRQDLLTWSVAECGSAASEKART